MSTKEKYENSLSDFEVWTRQHENFMTPKLIDIKKKGDLYAELSQGCGFDHKSMFGVSVVEYDDETETFKTGTTGLSKCFCGSGAEEEAKAYFNEVL